MLYVFVYGTLRRGEINDVEQLACRRGLPAPSYLGTACVPGRLVDFGDWPGLIPRADGDARVRGEVYAVSEALLAAMDEVEEYDPGGDSVFVRREVDLHMAGQVVRCQYYPIAPRLMGSATPIDHGDWRAYRLARETADTGLADAANG